jgi:diaminohydroxyphosphoribosylaminopyrimidine deaminase/5-amino-6-(5-phosphoribosylamino)uracil reductase
MMGEDMDREWLLKAIELSRRCAPAPRAFSVGAVLVDAQGLEIAGAYSRELGDTLHAEEIALTKAIDSGREPRGATLYTSLEPCSVRLSGSVSCTQRILDAGIARVVFALDEPPIFVVCQGARILAQHGLQVTHLEEYGELVRAINGHLLGGETTAPMG